MKRFLVFFFTLLVFHSFSQQLVLRGDYPDPSVVKIGEEYWATATTSNWAPAFPILRSKDLVNWKTEAHVFPQLPAWADYYFWAPEISFENGKVYIYYAAHKKGGNLCVGVASADRPEGPYTDLGPLICQEVGSIDAFPMRDENGKLFLVWKEDANSVGKPTPIWAQELKEDRTALVGEKKELFRNNQSWEANLVEGVSMIRHGDYFYSFYAAAGCCGAGCSYVTGIARSKNLLGPWEKYPGNPVLKNGGNWNCPGHGTPVEKEGRYYFLYHAYDKATTIFTGREGLLQEFRFTPEGWIEFLPSQNRFLPPVPDLADNFRGKNLGADWQWSVFQQPAHRLKKGELHLPALPEVSGRFLAQKTLSGNYMTTVTVRAKQSKAAAGLAAIGDEKNLIMVLLTTDSIRVLQVRDGKETVLGIKVVHPRKKVWLRMRSSGARELLFFYSLDGSNYEQLNVTPANAGYLPPWDRALRVGLVSRGTEDQEAIFDQYEQLNH